ncbi:hypothetical protein B5M09_004288 [Aphanomyces astaci]|uniref:GOLD domain-containing protein n=1 Tax=Aphanomyces astaci TaxID=112090 RepID=A0A3R7Z5B5_APHAT|nr:hypothetical protein B5M09_004288 [Aphanomyces astaci]
MTRRAKEQRQKRLELKRTVETAEEIERRQKWTLLLKQIDTPARPRTMSAPQMLTWHSSHAVVAAAGKFELPVRVEHAGSELSYTFNTKDMDINFSITFAGTTSEEYMVHPTRCASHESTIRGCHKVPGPGTVVLVWDNEYSWINSKELSYHVGLAQTSSPPTGVSGRSLLEGELRTRQAKHRVLNESYDNLRLQCTKRAAAIDAIERQLEVLCPIRHPSSFTNRPHGHRNSSNNCNKKRTCMPWKPPRQTVLAGKSTSWLQNLLVCVVQTV